MTSPDFYSLPRAIVFNVRQRLSIGSFGRRVFALRKMHLKAFSLSMSSKFPQCSAGEGYPYMGQYTIFWY